jgi:hypothetical protein
VSERSYASAIGLDVEIDVVSHRGDHALPVHFERYRARMTGRVYLYASPLPLRDWV